jgi:hypothetical protein
MKGQPFGFSALRGYQENVKVPKPVTGECDPFSIITPYGHKIMRLMLGKHDGRSSTACYFIEITFPGEHDRFSIGRNGRITQPGRSGLGADKNRGYT